MREHLPIETTPFFLFGLFFIVRVLPLTSGEGTWHWAMDPIRKRVVSMRAQTLSVTFTLSAMILLFDGLDSTTLIPAASNSGGTMQIWKSVKK